MYFSDLQTIKLSNLKMFHSKMTLLTLGQQSDKGSKMSFQNPVFIPGPTNIPEHLRKACDMPTLDHRSPLFGQILHPARNSVRKILKSGSAHVFIFPRVWNRWMGNSPDQHIVPG